MTAVRLYIIIIFVFFVAGLTVSCYKEQPVLEQQEGETMISFLEIDGIKGFQDTSLHAIYFTIVTDSTSSFSPYIDFDLFSELQINGVKIENNLQNDLGIIHPDKEYELIARWQNLSDTFHLIFTPLPLIHFTCQQTIKDEPKIPAMMHLQYADDSNQIVQSFESFSGIEYRGNYSLLFEKKSYGVCLRNQKNGEKYACSLLNMRVSKDWVLDAMYLDKSRLRNLSSNLLWKSICRSKCYELPVNVNPGIDGQYVEVLVNHEYMGIFCLTERVDNNHLKFAEDQYMSGGVIYKGIGWEDGSTRFEELISSPPYSMEWEGWEQVYPENDTSWETLRRLKDVVVNSSDQEFCHMMPDLICIDNVIDYYLLLNLLLAWDNSGKNQILASYSFESPGYLFAWDLDLCWGTAWQKDRIGYTGIVDNNLIRRLWTTDCNDFRNRTRLRWKELRSGQLISESILSTLDNNYFTLVNSNAIVREAERWKDAPPEIHSEYEYMRQWMKNRLEYLDDYFSLVQD